jgi:IPT/TIG domain
MSKIPSKRVCCTGCLWIFAICILSGCGGSGTSKTVPPTLVSFSPASGAVGTLVTITGTDFSTTQSVSIGGAPAVPISESSSALVAFVMPGAVSGPVTGTTSSVMFASSSSFTVTATGVPANQQGSKLVGAGAVGEAGQALVALSADGSTALIGGPVDNTNVGATWAFTRSNGVWTQQGDKFVGTGGSGGPWQGFSVALSADGNTALIGGPCDNSPTSAPCNITPIGAAWVFTRSNGAWTQQGEKLVDTKISVASWQGWSVALSADGNTALIGDPADNDAVGAARVFTRSNGTWTQSGKLVGTGISGNSSGQGNSVAMSADGNTAVVGGPYDNSFIGAVWVFTRSNGVWSQQGNKLVGTGYAGVPEQGYSVAVSADGNTVLAGGYVDGVLNNYELGASWVFTRTNGVWSQQGNKLVGIGYSGLPGEGYSVALSADGNTAFIGGRYDDPFVPSGAGVGAGWVFTRSNGEWTQSGDKLIGTPYIGTPNQGYSVALSSDGNTAFIGGPFDNNDNGAVWVFIP